MRVQEFDYELPEDRIAQEPALRREDSRLMALPRRAGEPRHLGFRDLPGLLRAGDLLVLNDTRVLPARLIGRRAAPGTGGRVEALLVERLGPDAPAPGASRIWRALLKGRARPGDELDFGGGLLARVEPAGPGEPDATGLVRLALRSRDDSRRLEEVLEASGHPPTPPYIRRPAGDRREPVDRERYQTVYARAPGALAAPTAGLHFSAELLESIRRSGVAVGALTLHVGLGTFQPVKAQRVEEHRIHPERFVLTEELAGEVRAARRRQGRVVAVGTTVARVLEAKAGGEPGGVEAGEGLCDLFIYPGHRFRVVDALLTNFHLPRSTLLMLVSAFAGRDRVLAAYAEAIRAGYRFYSYGDAMLIA